MRAGTPTQPRRETVKLNSSALNSYLYLGQYDRFVGSLPRGDEVALIVFYRGFSA